MSNENPLPACPSSPNCYRSSNDTNKKAKQPFTFTGSVKEAQAKLQEQLSTYKGASLEKIEGPTMHFSFVTPVGKFTDDVVFHFDADLRKIHFRSASRVGWSDLGANRRRMKRIRKIWLSQNP